MPNSLETGASTIAPPTGLEDDQQKSFQSNNMVKVSLSALTTPTSCANLSPIIIRHHMSDFLDNRSRTFRATLKSWKNKVLSSPGAYQRVPENRSWF